MDVVNALHRKDRSDSAGSRQRGPLRLILYTSFLLAILLTLTTRSRQTGPSATYTGMQTCISSGCHADYRNSTYPGAEEFRATMHANVHHRPSPESIIIDRWFRSDTTLIHRDPRVKGSTGDSLLLRLHYDPSAGYAARLATTGPGADSTDWMRISYAFGGNGWLQRYLVEIEKSRYVLPFQYVLPGYRDRSEGGEIRFLNVDEWLAYDSIADRLRFRTVHDRTFVDASWDNACVGCHVGPFGLRRGSSSDSGKWIAEWPGSEQGDSARHDLNASIGCESCHGLGSLHAIDPTNSEYQQSLSPKLWDPAGGSRDITDRKLDLCNQCHNSTHSTEDFHPYPYDDAGNFPFLPGMELRDFVRDPTADGLYWGDGVTARVHHQSGQDYVRSKHYTGHVFPNGCYDCHSPHNNTDQPYMLNRDWYSLQKGEGCVAYGCHTAFANTERRKGQTFNIHAQHLQQHSQCVNCHYTKVASFGRTGQNEFSDHSDFVLRPSATIELRNALPGGMPNTCAISCHRNGYGDRNRPDAFFDVIEGEAMRAPDFGVADTNLMLWNEPSDIELADSLWEGFKRLYPQFITSVRTGGAFAGRAAITSISPNPAHDNVEIRFTLPHTERVRLAIYDAGGRLTRIVADAYHEAGTYADHWDCSDETKALVPSGIYFARLTGETFTEVERIMVGR